MHIAVNAVAARRGGAVRHLTPFLNGLLAVIPDAKITAYVPAGFDQKALNGAISARPIDIPMGLSPRRVVWDQWRFPVAARQASVAISPLNMGSMKISPPQVLFQRSSLYFDRTYLSQCDLSNRTRLAAHRAMILACVRLAERIVVPSHAMANMLKQWTDVERKLVVIPHGFDSFRTVDASPVFVSGEAAAWRNHSVRLLHVGDGLHHKNLVFLADILFGTIRALGEDVGLAVTVTKDDRAYSTQLLVERAKALGVLDRIHFLGPIPQRSVLELYQNASVFLFPSLTESFGFPLLEAIAAGVPTVASDTPAAREVGGQFALYYHSNNSDAAVSAVIAVLSGAISSAPSDREAYLAKFSWDRHCLEVASLISQVTS